MSYLNIDTWEKYQTQIAPNREIGFGVGDVINLLQNKCHYTVIKHKKKQDIVIC